MTAQMSGWEIGVRLERGIYWFNNFLILRRFGQVIRSPKKTLDTLLPTFQNARGQDSFVL
jgi:hypothetical protein